MSPSRRMRREPRVWPHVAAMVRRLNVPDPHWAPTLEESPLEPRSHSWVSQQPMRFLDTCPLGAQSSGLSHRERSGPCGPGFFPNPIPSGLGSVAGEVSAACSLDADYPIDPRTGESEMAGLHLILEPQSSCDALSLLRAEQM